MAKRQTLLLTAFVLLSFVLFLSSFKARAIVSVITLIGVVSWLVFSLSSRRSATSREVSESDTIYQAETFSEGALFEATLHGMREGLLVVDRDMRVVASNPSVTELFNSSEARLESDRLTELTRNPAIYSAFLDGLKGVERRGVKVEIYGSERKVFELSVIPLGPVSELGAAGALGVFFDITRTERLELVRQEFLSNVSHELRTPLTSILAFVETLENGALDDRDSSRRFLEIIRKNASRMQELIDDILELTAIEGGNVRLRIVPVDFRLLVDEVITSLAARASNHGIKIANQVPGGVTIYADARRLEQILANLVDNAIKFGRENGLVTIRYESTTRDEIVVEDNGEGIPAQHLGRLFERFYRVDRARSREMGGTGLGLAIVKHLALLHGGEVSVSSELGKGTAFRIHLPKGENRTSLVTATKDAPPFSR